MAHVNTRELKNGAKAYQVRWYDASRKERSKQFDRMRDAKAFKVEIERSLMRGTYIDPRSGDITFKPYAQQWRSIRLDHRPATADTVRRHLERFAYPHIGDLRMGAARRPDLQQWVTQLVHTYRLAPRTIHNVVATVGSVFAHAVANGLIAVNPCTGLHLPELSAGEVAIPTDEQLLEILAAFGAPWYRRLVAVAAGSGLRSAELRGLTDDRVDWLRRTIKVDRQLLKVTPDHQPVFGPPKSPAGYRTVPVAQTVIDLMVEQIADHGPGPAGIIFTGRSRNPRRPIKKPALSDALSRVLSPLGWPSGTGLHLFRHYYASLLIHRGLSVKVVQKRLGHDTAEITLNTYLHLWPDDEEDSRTAVEEVLGPIIAAASASPPEVRGSAKSPPLSRRQVTQTVRHHGPVGQVAGDATP